MALTRGACLIGLLGLAVIISSCSDINKPQMSQIPAFQAVTATAQVNKVRLDLLQQTALSIGAQAGLAWRSKQMNQDFLRQQVYLDRVFDFQELMLSHNILPPVLEEATNTLNLADEDTIRSADRIYKIVQPARFVTAIPSWRDYLLMNYQAPQAPNPSLLPQTNQERDVWNYYVQKGWLEGLQQAQDLLRENLSRLQRDFLGMILYHKLLAQNIVTPPYFAKAELGVTGNSNSIRINDQILRITAVSKLQPNSKLWNALLRYKRSGGKIPPGYLMK